MRKLIFLAAILVLIASCTKIIDCPGNRNKPPYEFVPRNVDTTNAPK